MLRFVSFFCGEGVGGRQGRGQKSTPRLPRTNEWVARPRFLSFFLITSRTTTRAAGHHDRSIDRSMHACIQVLMEAMHEAPDAPFARYTKERLPDLHALHALASDADRQLGGPGEEEEKGWECV